MLGLMQHHPLLLSSVIAHAARHHPRAEVVSVELDGTRHRSDYATVDYYRCEYCGHVWAVDKTTSRVHSVTVESSAR